MKTLQELLATVENLFNETHFSYPPEGLYDPIEYTMHLGGKRIRPLMLLAANQMFDGEENQVRSAAIGIETFHNFTLLHDDLMDKSPLRRGKTTVYRKWNENTAILSGDTMFALAWRHFLEKFHPNLQAILNCFNETAIEVCEGQQYDMDFEQQKNVTIDNYLMMIRKKTAVLLAGALKIGALYANAPKEEVERLYNFGIHLGLAFQLQDDLLDGYGDVAVFGKQTGQDIRDNKKTFLILRALEIANKEQKRELQNLFHIEGTSTLDDEAKVSRVLEIYAELGIKGQVEKAIAEEFALAQKEIDSIAVDNAHKEPLIDLMKKLLGREK